MVKKEKKIKKIIVFDDIDIESDKDGKMDEQSNFKTNLPL